MRIKYNDKLSVQCPTCGAEAGRPCVSRRYKNRWDGMPTILEPHDQRRAAFIAGGNEPTDDPEGHKYYLRAPVEVSIFPRQYLKRKVYDDPRVVPEFGKVLVYGEVIYRDELHPFDAWLWDLIPVDDRHRAVITFIERADGDAARTSLLIKKYLAKSEEELQNLTATDRLARAAMPLIQSRQEALGILATIY